MITKKTIRILSLDGGGMRGLASAYFLQRFCIDANLNKDGLGDYFDIIVGTSIGGIQCLAYGLNISPDTMINFFITQGSNIFNANTLFRPDATGVIATALQPYNGKVNQAVQTAVFATANPPSFYYNQDLIDQLSLVFGTKIMAEIKTNIIIPAWESTSQTPVLFSNNSSPYFIGRNFSLVEVSTATSAAPFYFPPVYIEDYPLNDNLFIDGGVYQNNMSQFALTLADILYPEATRISLLSVGTGLGELGFDNEPEEESVLMSEPNQVDCIYIYNRVKILKEKGLTDEEIRNQLSIDALFIGSSYKFAALDNIKKVMSLIDTGITGSQEAVAKNLQLQSSTGRFGGSSGGRFFYYRFQPQFAKTDIIELDSSDEVFLSKMKTYADATYEKDALKIGAFIQNMKFN